MPVKRSTTIVGWITLTYGTLMLISGALLLIKGVNNYAAALFGGGILIFASLYTAYKVLYKKEELTVGEWIALLFLFVFIAVSWMVRIF